MKDTYKVGIASLFIACSLGFIVYTTIIKPRQQIKASGALEFSSEEAIKKEISQIESLIQEQKYQQALAIIESRKELMSENEKIDPRLNDLEKKIKEYVR